MRSIVEGLKLEKRVNHVFPDSYKTLLTEAGFKLPITQYPIITPDAIEVYLRKRIDEKYSFRFIKVHRPRVLGFQSYTYGFELYYREPSSDDRRVMQWNEADVSATEMTPPVHVLESIKRAKKHFQYLKVVTITDEKAKEPDPLIVGMQYHDTRRYLIDWWDSDIDPTDLIETPDVKVPS